jgi:hypothetical protein
MSLEPTHLMPLTQPAPLPKPVLISRQKLGMGTIGSMAVSTDGQRVYLGRRSSYERRRLNLGVLSLDAAGQPMGKPKLYADGEFTKLPIHFDRHSTVARILVGPEPKNPQTPRKLYLTVIHEGYPNLEHGLTVYDLAANGDPIGPPRTYVTRKVDPKDQVRFVMGFALALHPDRHLLYLVGYSDRTAVFACSLKEGEPSGPLLVHDVGDNWKAEVAVSAGGERLYLGTFEMQNGKKRSKLEVVDLDLAGAPLQLHPFPVPTRSPASPDAFQGPFLFHYTPTALYRRHPLLPVQAGRNWNIPDVWPLYVWALDGHGYPTGGPQPLTWFSSRAEAVSPDGLVLCIARDDTFAEVIETVMAGGKQITDGTIPWAFSLLELGGTPLQPGQSGLTGYLQVGALMEATKETARTDEAVYHAVLLTEPSH